MLFIMDAKGVMGPLVKNEWYKPPEEGVLVYCTVHSGDLSNELSRVEAWAARRSYHAGKSPWA